MPVNPTSDQIAAISAVAGTAGDGPLVMVNLNRYRERAAYESTPPGGGSAEVTGHEAYDRYSATAVPKLLSLGGEVLWYTQSTMTVIGDESDLYDEVITVRYPSAQAFLDYALDPEVMIALAHRTAGLERSALICCEVGVNAPKPDN